MLSMVAETAFFTLAIEEKKKKIQIFLFFLSKMALVNWLLGLVLAPMYPDSEVIQYLNLISNFISLIIGCAVCTYILSISVLKLCLLLCVAEVSSMACTFVPVYLILLCTGKTMTAYQTQRPGWEVLLHVVVTLAAIAVVRRILRPFIRRLVAASDRHRIVGNIFMVLYIMTGFAMTVMGDRGENRKFIYPGVVTAIAVLVFLVGYLYLQHKQTQYLKLQNENLKLQKELIMEHYQSLSSQIELTRRFRHDIVNHMQTIESLLGQAKKQDAQTDAYVDTLKKQYDKLIEVDYCDNYIVDAAVSNKVKICKQKEIPIQISLRRMELGNIEEIDMLGLIFNLLDNAIESCLLLPKEERYITFGCENCKGQLIITLSNSALDAGKNGKLFATKKQDANFHGVGMSIVREIVEKYNGQMQISFEKPDFRLQIMLQY